MKIKSWDHTAVEIDTDYTKLEHRNTETVAHDHNLCNQFDIELSNLFFAQRWL